MDKIKTLISKYGPFRSLIIVGVIILGLLALATGLSGSPSDGPYSGDSGLAWLAFFFIIVPVVIGLIYLIYSLIVLGRSLVMLHQNIWSILAIIFITLGLFLLLSFGLAGGPNKGGVKVIHNNRYIQAQAGAVLLLAGIICSKLSSLSNRK